MKFPLVVERYALIADSGGAGRYRGGLGLERVVRARVPMTFNSHVERAHCKPWGLEGGGEATGNEVAIRVGGKWKTDFPNAKVLVAYLEPGDAFRMRSGGGGGYGSPLDRPIERGRGRRQAGLHLARGGQGLLMASCSIRRPSRPMWRRPNGCGRRCATRFRPAAARQSARPAIGLKSRCPAAAIFAPHNRSRRRAS